MTTTTTTCPRCAGTNGNHGQVHVRHGNGGGHNEPCPNTPAPDPYPEHTRMAAVRDQAEAIGQFLDESGYILAEHRQLDGYREEVLMPVAAPVNTILAGYFGIDLAKIDTEQRAMLDALRQAQA
jgi:hypothetical protein